MATQANQPNSDPPQHKEVEHFTDAERAAWLKDGTMPPLEEENSSPSPKDASAASTPASERGGKEPGSGPGKKERDTERNWRALEAERDDLRTKREAAEKELDEWRSGRKKPEEKKAEPAAPKLLEQPKRPKMTEFRDAQGNVDVVKYEDALDKYDVDRKAYDDQQNMIRGAAVEQQRAIEKWSGELKSKYGDKASAVDVKKTVDLLATTTQKAPAFFAFLNDSEVFTDLLYVLGTDSNLQGLIEEAEKQPTKAIRRLIALEEGVRIELAKAADAKKKENGSAEGEQSRERKLTQAGKPPSESAGASSSPNDDGSADAAWRRKDLSPSERGELYRERKNKEEREKRKKSN